MASLLLPIIYLAFISLGLPDALLGAAWPTMYPQLGAQVSWAGGVSMIISACTILSALASDRLNERLGTGRVTAISVATTAAALLGFSFCHAFWQLCLWAIPYGLGAGAIDAALNNYVALHYKAKHMSWLHCFWGVGTIISPFIMGYALANRTWNDGYRIVGSLQLAIAVLLLVTLPVWRVNRTAKTEAQAQKGISGVLRIKGVPAILVGFFAYCAAEGTAMQWASTYFAEVKGLPAERAASLASLFYIGITAGRFVSGFLTDRLGDRNMIRIGSGVLACGIAALLIPTDSYAAAFAAFLIIGFGCAPIYPCIIHSTPDNFGAENSGAIIGIQMASAYVGSTFIPPLFGLLGSAAGFTIMPLYLLAFFALMLVMVETAFRSAERRREKAEQTRRIP